jgi:hypothetical protein
MCFDLQICKSSAYWLTAEHMNIIYYIIANSILVYYILQYHELFLRGRPYLAMRMKRHKVKGTGIKLTPNPAEEPLFYRDYPYMDQLDETRAVAPLPPLPPDRVVFPDQETSLDNAGAHMNMTADGSVAGSANSFRTQQPPLQFGQFPQFSHPKRTIRIVY